MEGARKGGEMEEQMEEVKEGERAWRHDGKEKRDGKMEKREGIGGRVESCDWVWGQRQ